MARSGSGSAPERRAGVRIEALDSRGAGLASDRRVVVRGALVGDTVDVAIEHVRRDGVAFGRTLRVIDASPNRVDVPCDVFLDCGGCDFLHASLEAQHAFKRQTVAEALGLPIARVAPVVASARTFGYRALAKLVVGPSRELGSYRPRTHDVVDMRGCVVHAPEAEAIVDALRALVRAPEELDLRYVLVRASLDEGRAVVTLVTRTKDAPGIASIVEALAERDDVATVVQHVNDGDGDALLGSAPFVVLASKGAPLERIGPIDQRIEAGAFNQVNPLGAASLYAAAVAGAAPKGRRVVDLYAGSGGLSLSLLAAGATHVESVEASEEAVRAAAASAESMGFASRLDARAGRVEDHLDLLEDAPIVVLNPPRKGVTDTVRAAIAEAPWRRLVYVSCDPKTLARDVAAWPATIASVTPVDLFVHTRHVETVLVLDRS